MLVQRSITSFGLSQVILTFEDDVDIYWARQQVAERLPDAEVPEGIEPHLGPNDTPVGQVYQYTLESDHHTPERAPQLAGLGGREAADAHARRRRRGQLRRLPEGVPRPRRSRRAARHGLTLKDLIDAVAASNAATSGGYVQHGEAEFVVRGRGYLRAPRTSRTPWSAPTGGTPVLVRNVAQVVEALHAAARLGGARRGHRLGRGDGPAAPRREPEGRPRRRCTRRSSASTTSPAAGMKIVPFYDRTRLVDTTLRTVSHNMLEGIALVGVVVWIFLRALIGSIAVSIVMPLALLTAFVGLYYAGVPANLLSMGAIDFGILLEGAVILVENAYRHLAEEKPPPERVAHVVAERRQGGDPPDAVLDGDHRRGDAADLHPRAGRGPHLPAGGADLRVRARRARCSSRSPASRR